MRFGLITSSYPRTPDESINAGVFVRAFALGLQAMGHDVSIFTPAKGAPMMADAGLALHTFRWWGQEAVLTRLSPAHPFDILRIGSLWIQGSREILAWGKSQHFDRLLAFWAIPSGWFGYKLHNAKGIPLDVWVLGSDIWERHRYPFGRWVVKTVLRSATQVFADGIQLQAEAKRLSSRPVTLLRSVRDLPVKTAVAQLPGHRCKFLFVGRWDRVKGLDLFLEAFRSLIQDEKAVEAHIFGEGPMKQWLYEQVTPELRSHIYIHDLVSREVLTRFLKAGDFLVIPSRQESLPVIFSDAIRCGLPVIAADVGDLREFIDTHRVGIVVPPENAMALRSAMNEACNRGKASWATACEKLGKSFNPSDMVNRYLQQIGTTS